MTKKLEELCYEVRKDILTAVYNAGNNGHPAGSFSLVEILAALYESGFLNTDPAQKDNPNRNILITGGSHSAALPQYSLLSRYGFFEREKVLDSYRTLGGTSGHPKISVPGIESNEGSLGMAIPKAVSFALANSQRKVYAISSDADFQEGLTQEALGFAGRLLKSNFVYMINANGFGLDGEAEDNYKEKLEALGFTVIGKELSRPETLPDISKLCDTAGVLFQEGRLDYAIDGNSAESVLRTYEKVRELQEAGHEKSIAIVFNTVKGAKHKRMAGDNKFHAKFPALTLEQAVDGIIRPGEEYVFPERRTSSERVRKSLGDVFGRLADKYDHFMVLSADTGSSTGTLKVKERHPERYVDVGCREQLMVSVAEGYALQGIDTVAVTFGQFLANRAREQIISLSQLYAIWREEGIKPKAATILIGTHNGLSAGKDDISHHCLNAYELVALPEVNVLHAADQKQLEAMVEFALQHKGLYYIAVEKESEIEYRQKNEARRFNDERGRDFIEFIPPNRLSQVAYFKRESPVTIHDENYQFELGKPEVLRDGDYVTIVTTGLRTYDAVFTADILAQEGKRVRVVQLPTISNIDEKELERALSGSKNIMVVEEQLVGCGIGEKLRLFASERGLNYRHLAVDGYAGSDSYCNLLAQKGLDIKEIVEAVRGFKKERGVGLPTKKTLLEKISSAAIAASFIAAAGGGMYLGHNRYELEKSIFAGCQRHDDIGTVDYICSTERDANQLGSPAVFRDNGNFVYRFFFPVVP